MKKNNEGNKNALLQAFANLPQLQFSFNKEVVIEGSRGVLFFSEELIRINTTHGRVAFKGRSIDLTCISPQELIISGFITNIEFSV